MKEITLMTMMLLNILRHFRKKVWRIFYSVAGNVRLTGPELADQKPSDSIPTTRRSDGEVPRRKISAVVRSVKRVPFPRRSYPGTVR